MPSSCSQQEFPTPQLKTNTKMWSLLWHLSIHEVLLMYGDYTVNQNTHTLSSALSSWVVKYPTCHEYKENEEIFLNECIKTKLKLSTEKCSWAISKFCLHDTLKARQVPTIWGFILSLRTMKYCKLVGQDTTTTKSNMVTSIRRALRQGHAQ